jgi:hypothetical protein
MPWGRLDDSLYDHPKLDLVPVEERLAAIGLWARAISWCNRFLTDGMVPRARIEKLDGTTELADQLVAAGLFEATSTGYIVHDFLHFNDSRADILERRAKEAKRKADYRASKGQKPRPNGTNPGTARSDDDDVPPGVPASVPPGHPPGQGDVSRDVSQRDSRTRESRPVPTRPDPSRPTESLERGSARAARADVQALRDRGWPRVTKAQRAILDEVAGRHDQTGYGFAAEVIRNTAPDADPLESVMAADRMWQARQRQQADQAEEAWQRTKAEEREQASTVLGDLAPDDVDADVKAWIS